MTRGEVAPIVAEPGPDALVDAVQRLEAEVGKVVVGQDEVVRQVVITLVAGGHALLEGVPGLGKTLLVRTLAECLGLRASRIQFTPDLMPADVTGTSVLDEEGGSRRFRFEAGPVFANLVLADEINRATPKTQSALLEAMAERTVTAGGQTRPLPAPFFVLATQNPLEQEGTYPLPEAQLDRFFFKVRVPLPPAEVLRRILDLDLRPERPEPARVVEAVAVLGRPALLRDVPVADHLRSAAVALVLATQPDRPDAPEPVRRYLRFGAGVRAMQALVAAAQVRCLLEGRYNVAAEDLRAVAAPALRHRLGLNFEAQADGVGADELVRTVTEAVL